MQNFQYICIVLILNAVSSNSVHKLTNQLKGCSHDSLPLSTAIELINGLNQSHHNEDLSSEHQLDVETLTDFMKHTYGGATKVQLVLTEKSTSSVVRDLQDLYGSFRQKWLEDMHMRLMRELSNRFSNFRLRHDR
jgi:hypothetical protein